MQHLHRISPHGQIQGFGDGAWQQVNLPFSHFARLGRECAQRRLRNPPSARVHRRQVARQCGFCVRFFEGRMHHLQAVSTIAHITKHSSRCTHFQRLNDVWIEVKVAQRQPWCEIILAVVTHAAQQHYELTTRLELCFGMFDDAFHYDRLARHQLIDRPHLCLVFVAHRKVQQHVSQMLHAQFRELGSQGGRQIRLLSGVGSFGCHRASLSVAVRCWRHDCIRCTSTVQRASHARI